MRNDVKLGLAVGGLLLGVVLAYALFFSNTNKDRKDLTDGGSGALSNNSDAAQKPAPANTDQTATDSNSQTGAQPVPLYDQTRPHLLVHRQGRIWQLRLLEPHSARQSRCRSGTRQSRRFDHSS